MFDDFSCVMIDGVRKPFLLYGRYGSLSRYIVLATSDVKLCVVSSLRCMLSCPILRIGFKLRMVTFRNAYKENLDQKSRTHPQT